MKKTVDEFQKFIMRGNVIDMAVGVIVGGAFGKVVSSLVNDLLMPPIGLLLGKVDFTNLFISLSGKPFESLQAAQAAGAPTLNYGQFLNTVVNFVIVAFCIFLVIKQVNKIKQPKPVTISTPPTTKECPQCFMTISLKAKKCPHCTSQIGNANPSQA